MFLLTTGQARWLVVRELVLHPRVWVVCSCTRFILILIGVAASRHQDGASVSGDRDLVRPPISFIAEISFLKEIIQTN